MRILPAIVFAYFLTACSSVPGTQTLGIDPDPQAEVKQAIVAATLAVDAVGAYGTLPSCKTVKGLCKDDKAYMNAKLIVQSGAGGLAQLASQKSPTGLLLTAGLVYMQWQLTKTITQSPGPTDPNAPPAPALVAQLAALQAADVLIQTADQRVRDAAGPNVTVGELLDELQAKVAALP